MRARKLAVLVAASLRLLAARSEASASEGDANTDRQSSSVVERSRRAPPPEAARSYSWQPVIADLTSATLVTGGITAGIVANSSGVAVGTGVTGAVSLLTVPPLIHLAHRRPTIAALDFGMRAIGLGASGAAFAIASAAPPHCPRSDAPLPCTSGGEALAGVLLGTGMIALVGAIVLDASVFSKEPARAASTPPAELT
jgi:hypothetical protein